MEWTQEKEDASIGWLGQTIDNGTPDNVFPAGAEQLLCVIDHHKARVSDRDKHIGMLMKEADRLEDRIIQLEAESVRLKNGWDACAAAVNPTPAQDAPPQEKPNRTHSATLSREYRKSIEKASSENVVG